MRVGTETPENANWAFGFSRDGEAAASVEIALRQGLFDLLNIVVAGLSDANWIGLATEGYVFVGAIYWTICFGMSRMSARFEGNDRPNRPSRMAAGVPE